MLRGWFTLGQPKIPMAGRIPARFPAKIERTKSSGKKTTFDVHVAGYFVAPAGKPKFEAKEITVDGADWLDIRNFYPAEIAAVNKYALSVVYPKLIGVTK